MIETDLEPVAIRFQWFAEHECKGYSDLYYALADAVTRDRQVLEFISGMPDTQPNLFFAAIQYLTGPEQMPADGRDLNAFVTRRGAEITELMRARRTQTNEVGRCAVLLPALPTGAPLALLEVGASAGLCLLLDRFFYDFGARQLGDSSASVRLKCEVDGAAPLPRVLPTIAWRAGLDPNPIDVHDDDATKWLLSCVWADHAERRERLVAAIQLAKGFGSLVRPGDMADALPSLLAEAPDDATLVVFHSAVLGYVSPDHRQRFAQILSDASRGREIIWLSNEGPGVVPEILELAPLMKVMSFLLGRTRFSEGIRRDEFLGFAHPHGGSLEWLGSSDVASTDDRAG